MFVFFFQAEDGIRDLVRSRGLGDVYKRQVFDPHRVYYPTAGGKHLVPDVRWFAGGPRLVTALARAQLGPVPDYLAGAVDTGFPADVTLAVDAVSVESGIAPVVLTPPASTTDVARRRAIWAQMVATLLPVPGVTAVSVEVQGAGRLAVPEVTGPLRSASDVGFGAEPLPLPRLEMLRRPASIDQYEFEDFRFADYQAHPHIAAPVAV